MLDEILTAAGVRHEPRGRLLRMPDETYAVSFDNIDKDSADRVGTIPSGGLPGIYHHSGMIELYETKPDPKAEAAIEREFDARGVDWEKQDRYWLPDVQRYQVIYETSYTTKTK